MNWNQIVGQAKAKAFIADTFKQGRLPHAILIAGPNGTGELPLGLALASLLQCQQPEGASPCGNCNACKKSFQMIHPDINYIFPVANLDGNKRQVNDFLKEFREAVTKRPYLSFQDWTRAAGIDKKRPNINIADIRSVIQTLSMSRYEGRKRIMLIWLPEFLGKEGNVLLKLIEEPEDHTHLILVTEQKEAILSTIRSRCQSIETVLLDDETIADELVRRKLCSTERALQTAWLSNGNFNAALASISEEQDHSSVDFLHWLRTCYKGHPKEISDWVDLFGSWTVDAQRHFLHYGLHFLEQCLRAAFIPESQWRLSDEEKESVKKLMTILSIPVIEKISTTLNKDLYHLERNANAKMMIMGSSIDTHHLLKATP